MKYALNLAEDYRILSACVVFPKGNYSSMPIVDMFPEGDVTDYLYVDGGYTYSPVSETEQVKPEEEITVWDELDAAYQAGYNKGYVEGVNSTYEQ